MKKLFFILFTVFCFNFVSAQYCVSTATSTADGEIYNVNFASINNTSSCGSNSGSQCIGLGSPFFYSDFTNCGPLTTVLAGNTYTFSVTCGTCSAFSNFFIGLKIFIDYNKDLDFLDPGEEVYLSSTASSFILANQQTPIVLTGAITIPLTASPGITRMRLVQSEIGGWTPSITAPSGIKSCGTYSFGETEDYSITIIPPIPCTGPVSSGTVVPSGVVNLCPTASLPLSVQGNSQQINISYQWLVSTNGGLTYTSMLNDTLPYLNLPPGTSSGLYVLSSVCNNNLTNDTTLPVQVNIANPTFAPIPYAQDFESWISYCSTNDVPDNSWLNSPNMTSSAWRRNDQGSSAGWANANFGNYIPAASTGNYSARFHGYGAGANAGQLDLYLDLSATPGTKQLLFDYNSPQSFGSGSSVTLFESTNGAAGPFTPIAVILPSTFGWETQSLNIASNSATYVLRFKATGFTFDDDCGIDNLKVLPPCNGTPVTGILAPDSVCSGFDFKLTLSGSTQAGGLTFDWQEAPSAGGPWSSIGTTNFPEFFSNISTPTYYRCVVTCSGSGLSATSPVKLINLRPFFYCYCENGGPLSSFDDFDIGNVTLVDANNSTLLNHLPLSPTDTFANSLSFKSYTAQWAKGALIPQLYRDSNYIISVTNTVLDTFTVFGATAIYIDVNRDGLFDPLELLAGQTIKQIGAGRNSITASFTIPSNAKPGLTGMRVISEDVSSAITIDPCFNNGGAGEVEDYIVEILRPNCKAPLKGGTAFANESIVCPGYTVLIIDSASTDTSAYNGLSIIWQRSFNNGPWTNIPGSNTYTINPTVNAPTKFRFAVICNSGDTAYSNEVFVDNYSNVGCYPASSATGGINDSSDNGYFTIGSYSFSTNNGSGPHLGNPNAVHKRTNFASLDKLIKLYADSTYKVSFYNTLKGYVHADAKITMFIDYNNNKQYDVLQGEKIFTGLSGSTTFYLPMTFTTATNPILNSPTGMRLILNNNVAPNAASDNGVGNYVSGETEDFLVMFIPKPVYPASVNDVFSKENVLIYPNPSDGKIFVNSNINNMEEMNIIVSTITGAEVFRREYKNINGEFKATLDLEHLAKGTYTIKMQSNRGSVLQKIVLQ